jgi:predicted nucleic acid-binding protein
LDRAAVKVKPPGRLKISTHEDDNRVHECAVAAKANYIVTENTKDFPVPHKYTKIINARALLVELTRE